VLHEQLQQLRHELETQQAAHRASQEASEGRALQVAACQVFLGASLRNAAVCLNAAFPEHPNPKFIYFLAWLHNTRPFEECRRKGLTMLLERTLARCAKTAIPGRSALKLSA